MDFETVPMGFFEKVAEWISVGSLVEQFTDGKDRGWVKRIPPSDGLHEENAEPAFDSVFDCPVYGRPRSQGRPDDPECPSLIFCRKEFGV